MRSAWRKSEARVEMETGRMNVAMEADRELLWALLRRRAEELPTVALGAAAATFAELASTTARLLAAGPTHPDEEPLPEADVPRVLAARDAVVGGCARAGRHPRRGTPGADADLRPGHLVSDSAYVLHDALRARPAVAPGGSRRASCSALGGMPGPRRPSSPNGARTSRWGCRTSTIRTERDARNGVTRRAPWLGVRWQSGRTGH
jgi:hypothetical protein